MSNGTSLSMRKDVMSTSRGNLFRTGVIVASVAALVIMAGNGWALEAETKKDVATPLLLPDPMAKGKGINLLFPQETMDRKSPIRMQVFVTAYPVWSGAVIPKDILGEYGIDMILKKGSKVENAIALAESLVDWISGADETGFEANSYAEALRTLAEKDGEVVNVVQSLQTGAILQATSDTKGAFEAEIQVGGYATVWAEGGERLTQKILSGDEVASLVEMDWNTIKPEDLPGDEVSLPLLWTQRTWGANTEEGAPQGGQAPLRGFNTPDSTCLISAAKWTECYPELSKETAGYNTLGSWYKGSDIKREEPAFWGWYSLSVPR